MIPVLDFVVQLVLGVAVTAFVVRWDMRRLPAERRGRGWNEASFWSAVVAFGPLSIPVHFVRTRRSVVGLVAGIVWAAGVLLVLAAASALLEWSAGLAG